LSDLGTWPCCGAPIPAGDVAIHVCVAVTPLRRLAARIALEATKRELEQKQSGDT
jgi:hypothetical protein